MHIFTDKTDTKRSEARDITLTPTTQAWHTRMVTSLMHSACGDLILSRHGNLCSRDSLDDTDVGFCDLPWAQHKVGMTLAWIAIGGWVLTADGAQWILENCPPKRSAQTDLRRLREVALVYSGDCK